jgi:cysteine-rich repeat protein
MKISNGSLTLLIMFSTQYGCVKKTPSGELSTDDSAVAMADLGTVGTDMAVISRDGSNLRTDGAMALMDAQLVRDMLPATGSDAAVPDAMQPPEPRCGNAAPEGDEECDDGQDTAECDGDCTRPSCGDGYWNQAAGEACDDGAESVECNADCTRVRCGDGIVNELAGEVCDDGNVDHLDGCSPTCQTIDITPCNVACVLGNTYSVFEPVHRHTFQERGQQALTLFGTSIAQNQRWTLIGVDPLQRGNVPYREGVFVYGRGDDGAWDLGTFLGVDPEHPIQFGRHVDLQEDTILVGAWGDRENEIGAGAAYVYEFVDQAWRQTARLLPQMPVHAMSFGRGVCLSLPYAFVAAILEEHDTGSGTVTVFRRNPNGDWLQVQKFAPLGGENGNRFGFGMDTDGTRLVVSVEGNGGLVNPNSVAHVYRLQDDGRWLPEAVLREPGDFSSRNFGTNVAIRDDTVLVGGFIRRPNEEPRGAVLVYHRNAQNEWSYATTLLADDDDVYIGFGDATVLGDGFAVIGSGNVRDQFEEPGNGYVFERLPDNTWVRRGRLFSPDIDGSWSFGKSIAVRGRQAVFGAPGRGPVEAPNQGRAYLFDLWQPICHQDGSCFCRPGFAGDLCADAAP